MTGSLRNWRRGLRTSRWLTRELAVLLMISPMWSAASTGTSADTYQQLHDLGLQYEQTSNRNPTNYRRAYWAYCVAARFGHADAAYRIAWMYLNGRGLPQDDRLAGHWLKLSAKLGDHQAKHLLERLSPDVALDDLNCPLAIANKRINLIRFKAGLNQYMPPQMSRFDVMPQLASGNVGEHEQQSQADLDLTTRLITPNNKLKKLQSSHSTQGFAQQFTATTSCDWTIASVYPSYRQRVIAWLDEQSIDYNIRKQPDTLNPYHIIMVYPNDSRAAALAIANRLQAQGYASTRVFGSGEYKYAVSLGVFRRATAAQDMLKSLLNRGYTAIERIMKHPPVIPMIHAKLSMQKKQQLKTTFPPLVMAQAGCG